MYQVFVCHPWWQNTTTSQRTKLSSLTHLPTFPIHCWMLSAWGIVSSDLVNIERKRIWGTVNKILISDGTVVLWWRDSETWNEPYYFGTSLSCQNQPSSVTPNSQRKTNLKRRNTNELLLYGHELVCIDTYVGKKVDELTVHKGDWIYADMKLKDSRGWIWAYSPANKLQGYVPRSCVRPPATTPL